MNLESVIDYSFQDHRLLQEALSHPSLSCEVRPAPPDNQRLEFLGDAVLELVVTHHLFQRFPDLKEGLLTKLRASVVSRPALAQAARRINLGQALILSNGEEINGGRNRDSNLADVFESLLGAIYLDGGFPHAQRVTLALLKENLDQLQPTHAEGNHKGELQEILQKIDPANLQYRILSQEGPPHARLFVAGVFWRDQELGTGSGPTKKTAESTAAQDALHKKLWQ